MLPDPCPHESTPWRRTAHFQGRRAGLNRFAEAFGVPDDPHYSPLTRIQSEASWDVTGGFRVRVAVLGTGLAPRGTDGVACVTASTDMVNGDDDPFDGDGHGTHVSGTIAQSTDNEVGCADFFPS